MATVGAKTAQVALPQKPMYLSRSAGKRLLRTGWDWMGLNGTWWAAHRSTAESGLDSPQKN